VARSSVAPAFAAVLVLGGVAVAIAADRIPAYVDSAVADTTRPAADRDRDADRKPAEVLAFSGVKPGDNVGEFIPGGGYYTRLLSKVVGPTGHVYALWPDALAKMRPQMVDASKSIAPNVVVVLFSSGALLTPQKLDMVWTSENYHDFHNGPPGPPGAAPAPPADMAGFNKAVYDALKPGGVYLIEDHAGAAGTGTTQTSTLHRIDPAAVKSEVEAAGFKLAAQSDVLANPNDPHTAKVFDPSIRGHTDKILFKFVKP
jgi:predicted methyltransferase